MDRDYVRLAAHAVGAALGAPEEVVDANLASLWSDMRWETRLNAEQEMDRAVSMLYRIKDNHHVSTGMTYGSIPPQWDCKVCGARFTPATAWQCRGRSPSGE